MITPDEVDEDGDMILDEDELNALTKAQLVTLAAQLGVEISSSATKAQIVAAILDSQRDVNEEVGGNPGPGSDEEEVPQPLPEEG